MTLRSLATVFIATQFSLAALGQAPVEPSPQPVAPSVAPAADSTDLPTPDALFEKYVQAIGGMDAIKRHTAVKYVGTVKVASLNYSAFLTLWQVAPSSLVLYIEPPGVTRSTQYCDGTLSWGYEPPPNGTGWSLFEGEQHADMLLTADFYGDAEYKNRYDQLNTVESTDFNGHPAFKVFAHTPNGKEQFLFFDAETGLILGQHTIQIEGGNPVPLIIINDEYQEVDGVKYIKGQTHRTPGRDIVFNYKVIEPNPKDVPPIVLPDELKNRVRPPGAATPSQPSPAPEPAPEAPAVPPQDHPAPSDPK